jgi:adenylate kinase
MILDRLKKDDCKSGWLLDGFPRNPEQAAALEKALGEAGIALDYIIEISLDRDTARKRIMGRRLCEKDNNHPNNIYIDAIKPEKKGDEFICRVCGGALSVRADDQDEAAIDKRHVIYYDDINGTAAAVKYFKKLAAGSGRMKFIELDGKPGVSDVSKVLIEKLA